MWDNLKKILEQKNITIYRLSKMTGISDQTLRHLQTGADMHFSKVVIIADALNISLDKLMEAEK